MTSSGRIDAPFAGDIHNPPPMAAPEGDPYRALDELMAVVEALCPRWPDRATFDGSGRMLL